MRHSLLVLCGLWITTLGGSFTEAQVPKAALDNGVVHAVIDLPDPSRGFYRGTRFDWSGVIADLTFAGHSYYGPWFTKQNPNVRDFIFDGADITAGPCSSITGPAEEFVDPLGFDQASPGQTFVKIGVGVLRRSNQKKYDAFLPYEIVDPGTWKVHAKASSIEFTHKLTDPKSGYAYIYIKRLRLLPNQPVLVIEHELQNVGRLPIETSVYNHNFLVLDHQPIGPDFSVSVPFPIKPERPLKEELGTIDDKRILYRRPLEGKEVFTVHMGGLSSTARDYDIRVENSRLGAGVRITGDHPLEKEELWSIRSTLAMEPFVHLTASPGQTVRWSHSYTYYTFDPKSAR